MNKCLLDTDILSALMKKDQTALKHAQKYLKKYNTLTMSIITQYEILRGLKVKNATKQILIFENICTKNEILQVTDTIIIKATDIYSVLYKKGKLIGDADILIAATALVHNLELITNNENHFNRISGLRIDNWIK